MRTDDGGRSSSNTDHSTKSGSIPKVIGVFVLVCALAVGGFLFWRSLDSKPEAREEVQQSEQKSEADLQRERIDRLIDDLTMEQKVAQLFVVHPEALTDVDVATAAGESTRDALAKYPVGGFYYLPQNFIDRKQTVEMIHNAQNYAKDASGLPLFTCVSEEGGEAVCLANNYGFALDNVGDMVDLGELGDEDRARSAANAVGDYLLDVGINVNFAPVADVATSKDDPIYARSFSTSVDKVTPLVAAQVQGYNHSGVLCSVKHFPGMGGAEGDSHNDRTYSHATEEELLDGPIIPFKAAIEEDVPMVMVGNISFLELGNGEGDRPASLSKVVVGGLLRDKLGYDGLVITAPLDEDGVAEYGDPRQQGVLAIQAGADIILSPADFKRAYRGILDAVEQGDISEKRIDESLRRIIAAKENLAA